MKNLVIGIFIAGLALVGWRLLAPVAGGDPIEVSVPELSRPAAAGQRLFAANCASCHGQNGAGSEQGPPLVHAIYNPGHHSDDAFYGAVAQGARQHHWAFGNMPAQPQLSTEDVALIIEYVRELQVENGITYRQHQM